MKKLIFFVVAIVAITIRFLWSNPLLSGALVAVEICSPALFLLICYFFLAEKDIFFTFLPENKIKLLIRGEEFVRPLLSSHTHYIDPKTYDIKPYKDGQTKHNPKTILGMAYIGLPPFYQIHERKQLWQEWELTEEMVDGKKKVISRLILRREKTKILIVMPFAYGMFLGAAENKENIPIDLAFTVFLRPTNAYKPSFGNDDAYGQVQDIILAAALMYVKVKTFASLESEKNVDNLMDMKTEHDEFAKFLCSLNKQIPGRESSASGKQGLVYLYGYEVMGAGINDVAISGENKTMIIDATVAAYVAEQNAKSKVITGEAEAKVKVMNGKAEAEAMDAITNAKKNRYAIFKDNPEATEIEVAEKKFEKSKLTTYVENGKGVMPTVDINKKTD